MSEIVIIEERNITDSDSQILLSELNEVLIKITGDDGTANFSYSDMDEYGATFLVAYVDDIPYGCGGIRRVSDDVAEVKRIYARKNTCGIGRKIIAALEDKAIEYGYKELLLETRIQNVHAISFYEGNGFLHCEPFGKYIGKENAYCMRKKL